MKNIVDLKVSLLNDPQWKKYLGAEFEKEYMGDLGAFLKKEEGLKKIIYPAALQYFAAFNKTPFDKVKVVILGQDPYHGEGQAHGLSFSVPDGVKPPPSLKNIYKELYSDLSIPISEKGCLESWADQGVLLLNATLSVEAEKAGSHQKKGWELFTDRAIERLNENRENLVFILWGSYAQKKGSFVDSKKHLVLKSPHPSPLSAHRGFFGSKPFSKANHFLSSKKITPIQWTLPN